MLRNSAGLTNLETKVTHLSTEQVQPRQSSAIFLLLPHRSDSALFWNSPSSEVRGQIILQAHYILGFCANHMRARLKARAGFVM